MFFNVTVNIRFKIFVSENAQEVLPVNTHDIVQNGLVFCIKIIKCSSFLVLNLCCGNALWVLLLSWFLVANELLRQFYDWKFYCKSYGFGSEIPGLEIFEI